MLHFENDYNEGVHPKLLEALTKTNTENLAGYGLDAYTERASQKIKTACQAPDAQVFFLTGGTQTNQVVIDTMLAPYGGVIAAQTGHISVHEAGAIEYTGHKVLTLPHENGKFLPRMSNRPWRISMRMEIKSTWFIQAWFISLTRLNMGPSIARLS